MNMSLSVAYAEPDRTVKIDLTWVGEAYNPFEQEKDGLGITILKKWQRTSTAEGKTAKAAFPSCSKIGKPRNPTPKGRAFGASK